MNNGIVVIKHGLVLGIDDGIEGSVEVFQNTVEKEV